jgi:hypothetical protein
MAGHDAIKIRGFAANPESFSKYSGEYKPPDDSGQGW